MLVLFPFVESLNSDRPRPLLLIFDRTADIAPPLLHTSTYQALVDDLLDHHLNRVTIELPAKDGNDHFPFSHIYARICIMLC